MNLYLNEIREPAVFYLNLLFGITGIVIFLLGFFLLLVHREKLKDIIALLVLATILISVPLAIRFVLKETAPLPQALILAEIKEINVKKLDGEVVVSFETSIPAIAYLEYKDRQTSKIKIVIPRYRLAKRLDHELLIENVGEMGGEVTFILNGQRYLVDGAPLVIK